MLIPTQEVNSINLSNTLKNAFIDVTDVTERGFSVKVGDLVFDIRFDESSERINLQMIHNMAEFSNENMLKLLVASNDTNKDKTFIKSSVIDYEGRIYLQLEYTVRYDKGLNMAQFVSDLRFFDRVALASMREHFQGIV